MIHLQLLKDYLDSLQDYEWQREMWLPPYGDFGVDFVELVCQVFDDPGLSGAIEENSVEAQVGPAAAAFIAELDEAVTALDDTIDVEKLLDDPRMENVRVLARKILATLPEKNLNA